MLNRIKSAPILISALFALVLSLEIFSFWVSFQFGSIVRFFLLAALMFLTLGGLRIARNILIFLLAAGALFLAISGIVAAQTFEFKLFFHFLPTFILASTAFYLLLSKKFKEFLLQKQA